MGYAFGVARLVGLTSNRKNNEYIDYERINNARLSSPRSPLLLQGSPSSSAGSRRASSSPSPACSRSGAGCTQVFET